jgi:hypothetical protein
MQINFDIFNQFERPTLVLTNPNKEEIYSMGAAYNIQLKIKFNALSTLTFDVPAQTDNGQPVDYYNFLQAKRLVFIDNIGFFIIMTVEEDLKGMTNIKTVTCNSLEAELIYKKVTAFSGTFQFYNPISPSNTLLGQILDLIPTWSVGFIDGALFSVFRTFDINDKTAYDFLMNDVSTAYQCVFTFDTYAKTISAFSTSNATTNTDIFLSFDNLLKSGKFSELTDELVTALHVYGDGDLDIHSVNPLGSTVIYNFDAFKSLDWMSQELIDLLNAWEANIAIQQPTFSTLLVQYSNANSALITLQGQLNDANSQMSALVLIQRDRIQAGIPYADINAQIVTLSAQISSLNNLIALEQNTIVVLLYKLSNISRRLSFDFAFSPDKQSQLTILYNELDDANNILSSLQNALADLNHQIEDLSNLINYDIQQGIDHSILDAQVAALTVLVKSENDKITAQQVVINNIQNSIDALIANKSPQLLELNTFIIENTYQNSNFIVTDTMTISDRQDEAQQLYNQAQTVLQKVSQPRYEVSIDSTNFIFLKDFKPFTDQLVMGCVVTVDKGGNTSGNQNLFSLVLLELDFQYDDPTKFTITVSNRVRLDQSGFIYSDLFNQSVNAGTSVNFNSNAWSDWTNNSKDVVTSFISSALDATNNNIISSTNQEIKIDESGLRGRQFDPSNQSYKGDQVWLVNNMLAFTDNAWGSSKLALGRITVGSTSTFGLVADVIVGRILAGNQLTITNQNNTFTLDGNGATLTNASFTLTGNNGKNKILLNPTNGIKIQSLVNSQFVDKFFVDSSGNVNFSGVLNGASGNFSGTITANSGVIGGWSIGPTGINSPTTGDFIASNGNLKFGQLAITGGTAVFTGTIYAQFLSGQLLGNQIANNTITDSNIASLNADKIVAGTITGININGTIITWPGARMYSPGFGISVIDAQRIQIGRQSYSPFDNLFIDNGIIELNSNFIQIGQNFGGGGTIQFAADTLLTMDGSTALNRVVTISGTSLVFTSGLLTAVF